MRTEQTSQIKENAVSFGKKLHFDTCIHCGSLVNMSDEGVTYKNGTSAHEACHDDAQFEKENASDFRD